MDDQDVTAVLAEAARLVDAAAEAVLREFVEGELTAALVKVHEVIGEAQRVAAVRAARGKPLSRVNREALTRLYDSLARLHGELAGVVADAA